LRLYKLSTVDVFKLILFQGKEIEVAVATKVEKEAKQKGDLMANDAEAMEYSSEDISDDDLDDMNYAGYKNKRRRVS
jgi:hypothetical protein